ncbi:MAG: hypothetical protein IIB58_03790 [Planctomycetes bacterium]|nr:hypothetical protein [Planctomycetota bacterium]
MGFIKKNAFLLGCALGGILGVGLMLWGMSRMGAVRSEMELAKRLHGDLDRVAKNAVQPKSIEAEKDRIRQARDQHRQVLDHFAARNVRKPLLENLLPDPGKGTQGKQLRYDFRSKYQDAMDGLLLRLSAGQPPSKQELENTADYLRKKAMEEEEFGVGDGESPKGGAGRPGRGSSGPGKGDSVALPERNGPASTQAYWEALKERAQDDATMLTCIDKAHNIFCYASIGRGGSFDLLKMYEGTDEAAPGMGEIWLAQVLFWIQEDIVEALANVNDRAAARLDKPWVGNLPIKDVRSIGVSDYIQETDSPPATGGGTQPGGRPPEHPDEVFTHASAETLYDVINVRLRMVVDVRALPVILHELAHDKYQVVLNVSYEEVRPDLSFRGKIYGPQPVVLATIDLQTYLFYKVYVPLMPEVIREKLGIPQEQFDALVEELQGNGREKADSKEEQEDEG